MDLEDAVTKHAEWKIKFRAAIRDKSKMDAATLGKDDCCELGKWLNGAGKAAHGKRTSFSAVVDRHRQFHVEAGKVATTINAGKYAEAEAMLAAGTPYMNASQSVAMSILALKKDAGL